MMKLPQYALAASALMVLCTIPGAHSTKPNVPDVANDSSLVEEQVKWELLTSDATDSIDVIDATDAKEHFVSPDTSADSTVTATNLRGGGASVESTNSVQYTYYVFLDTHTTDNKQNTNTANMITAHFYDSNKNYLVSSNRNGARIKDDSGSFSPSFTITTKVPVASFVLAANGFDDLFMDRLMLREGEGTSKKVWWGVQDPEGFCLMKVNSNFAPVTVKTDARGGQCFPKLAFFVDGTVQVQDRGWYEI